ncbi:hypothetical protein B0H13DRAFT_1886915 [Mycena leptocephala]|nr:hypothetical protein B0H13DRAFT_1886915 [Mycena leptocephala]
MGCGNITLTCAAHSLRKSPYRRSDPCQPRPPTPLLAVRILIRVSPHLRSPTPQPTRIHVHFKRTMISGDSGEYSTGTRDVWAAGCILGSERRERGATRNTSQYPGILPDTF